jgi:hypothetical protein
VIVTPSPGFEPLTPSLTGPVLTENDAVVMSINGGDPILPSPNNVEAGFEVRKGTEYPWNRKHQIKRIYSESTHQ